MTLGNIQSDVGIFLNDAVSQYHFESIQYKHAKFYTNLENFCQDQFRFKYAGYHVPWEIHKSAWPEQLDSLYDSVNKIFLFCSELHEHTVKNLIKLDKPKIIMFLCGNINYQFKHAKIYRWMDWFHTTTYFYKYYQPNLLKDKLTFSNSKTHYFDVLLGCKRTHRDFVYNYIIEKNLIDSVIMTYHRLWHLDIRQTGYILDEDNIQFVEGTEYRNTCSTVKYYGRDITLSQIVPFSIYNNSYYSLVAETNAVNDFNFYTEKIVKPIMAKRLFIVIAGKGYLQNLRELGFKTFDGIIDESYDNEEDAEKRWSMALDQMNYLINQDPMIIQEKIKSIVEFNHYLMLTFDWFDHYIKNIRFEIDQDTVDIIEN
jgi:hypothetical protein